MWIDVNGLDITYVPLPNSTAEVRTAAMVVCLCAPTSTSYSAAAARALRPPSNKVPAEHWTQSVSGVVNTVGKLART